MFSDNSGNQCYQWDLGPSTSCAHPVSSASLPGRNSSLCLGVELAVLGADGQDWVFFLLFHSLLFFLSPVTTFFISGPFLFIFLPLCVSTFLSICGYLLVCLTTSLGCSTAWLSLCFSLSLSLSFPLFSLFSVFVTSFLCLSVFGWACLGCLTFSFQLSPSAWSSSLSSRQRLATGPRTQVVRGPRRSLAVVVGEAGTVAVAACPGTRLL